MPSYEKTTAFYYKAPIIYIEDFTNFSEIDSIIKMLYKHLCSTKMILLSVSSKLMDSKVNNYYQSNFARQHP